MKASEWIALLGVVAGIVGFISGLNQYIQTQKWKRAEFVVKEIKEFEAKPEVSAALQMLDWNARCSNVPGLEEPIQVTDELLIRALVPHTKRNNFSPEEVAVRDCFDELFDSLERFDHFIQSNLVTADEFRPYLIYSLRIMGDQRSQRKPPQFYKNLWDYINFYEYPGVQRLLKRYGYDIKPIN